MSSGAQHPELVLEITAIDTARKESVSPRGALVPAVGMGEPMGRNRSVSSLKGT